MGLWFAVISSTIAFAVAIGQTRYLGHKRIGFSHVSTAGLGALAGFFAGAIAQFAFCWGLAGALAGTALSWRIPNLRWHRGFAGGLLGGLIGGGFFILLSWAFSDVVGRAVGLTSIGFMIGAMIVAAETAFREAWIEVHYGPKESRTVSLGKQPTHRQRRGSRTWRLTDRPSPIVIPRCDKMNRSLRFSLASKGFRSMYRLDAKCLLYAAFPIALLSCASSVKTDDVVSHYFTLQRRFLQVDAEWIRADVGLLSAACRRLNPSVRTTFIRTSNVAAIEDFDTRKKVCDGVPTIAAGVASLLRSDNSNFSGDQFEDLDRKFEDLRTSTDSEIQSFPTSSISQSNFPPAAGSQFLVVHAHLASDAGEIDSKRAHLADDAYTQAQSQLDELSKESSAPTVIAKVATILSTVDGALGAAQGTTTNDAGNPVSAADEALPSAPAATPKAPPARPDSAAQMSAASSTVSTAVNQEQAVRSFYEAINSKDFDAAYADLSSSYRAGTSRQQFEEGYVTTVSVSAVGLKARDDGSNDVDVVLQAQDLKDGVTINTRFVGFWHVVLGQDGWLLDTGEFTKAAQD